MADYILILLIIVLLIYKTKQGEDFDTIGPVSQDLNAEQVGPVKPFGFASAPYMDNYKYILLKESQEPLTLFEAVNTLHTDDLLFMQCDINGNDCPYFTNPFDEVSLKYTAQCRTKDYTTKKNMIWLPVGKVISIMEVDALAVVVLDRPVELSGRRLAVAPTKESQHLWGETILPDPVLPPVWEVESMSRWQVY